MRAGKGRGWALDLSASSFCDNPGYGPVTVRGEKGKGGKG